MTISSQTLLSLQNLPGYGLIRVMGALEYLKSDINTPDELADFSMSIVGKVKGVKEHTKETAWKAIKLAQRTIEDSKNAGIFIGVAP